MRSLTLLLGLAVIAGCDITDDDDDDRRWETTLQARAGFEGVGGTGVVISGVSTFTATVTITGGTPGAVWPWHVHPGSCATGGPILGDPNAYPPLTPGADGEDTRTATINEVLVSTQSYMINVHLSPDDLDTIVACGDLVRR